MPKGTCPVCGKLRGLKKDGTIRAHGYRTAAWHGAVGDYCIGEGRRPKEYYMAQDHTPRCNRDHDPRAECNMSGPEAAQLYSQLQQERVHHPEHYKRKVPGIECIDVVQHFNFNLGNVIKYAWRAGDKGDYLEDLRKARQYLDFEIARVEELQRD